MNRLVSLMALCILADQGDLQAVSERVPRLVELDPEVTSIVEATEVLDELVTGLQEIRAAYS